MNEEEKKAIEWLNKYIKNIKHEWQESEDSKAVRTVLKLITKLQKENEEKDKQIDLMTETIRKLSIVLANYKGSYDKETINFTGNIEKIKQYFAELAKEKGE